MSHTSKWKRQLYRWK